VKDGAFNWHRPGRVVPAPSAPRRLRPRFGEGGARASRARWPDCALWAGNAQALRIRALLHGDPQAWRPRPQGRSDCGPGSCVETWPCRGTAVSSPRPAYESTPRCARHAPYTYIMKLIPYPRPEILCSTALWAVGRNKAIAALRRCDGALLGTRASAQCAAAYCALRSTIAAL